MSSKEQVIAETRAWVDRAVAAFPEAEAIYQTNIETLNRLGAEAWRALQQQCRDDAAAADLPPAA